MSNEGTQKPGIYRIQNIYTEGYLDIEVPSRDVCCRPARDLREGRGLWEIKQFGAGYTVQRFDPGEPEQFCTPLDGLQNGVTLRVAPYPVAWRIETVDDDQHRGFGYVRFYWGTKRITWDVASGRTDDGAKVVTNQETLHTWQIWKLVPMTVEGIFTLQHPPASLETPEPGSLPSYEEEAVTVEQSSTRAQHTESERDEFGTIVNEVTVVTTTVTTRKRYRVEDA